MSLLQLIPPGSPPYLVADTSPYAGDVDQLDAQALLADSRIVGVYMKASEGTSDAGPLNGYAAGWCRRLAQRLLGIRPVLLGAYHVLDPRGDGTAQGLTFLRATWGAPLEMRWALDIESASVAGVDPAQVASCAKAFVRVVTAATGVKGLGYDRGARRDLELADTLGLAGAWNPGATWPMPLTGLAPFGRDDVVLWQYAINGGDGPAEAESQLGVPLAIPGYPEADLSIVVDGARAVTWDRTIERLCGGLSWTSLGIIGGAVALLVLLSSLGLA